MPKEHHRVRSVSYYRPSPITTPTTAHYSIPSPYSTMSSRPLSGSLQNPYYTTSQPSMSQSQYPTQIPLAPSSYSTGGPVQHPLAPTSYNHPPIPIASPPPTIRPSSGAWNPTDDQTLMAARAQGLNWAPIQQTYFLSKTPNACRKRHERLMEKRNADDWDAMKLESLAKNYMGMRREIWSGLAGMSGEKWTVVEQKCMSQGLKNLQTAARSHARRERLHDASSSSTHPHTGGANGISSYEDSGIGIDDIDPEFDVGNEDAGGSGSGSGSGLGDGDEASERSPGASSLASHGHGGHGGANAYGLYQEQARQLHGMHGHRLHGGHHHQQQQQQQQGGMQSGQQQQQQQQQHYGHGHGHGHGGGRLPSMDMGIDAIINRPAKR